MPDTNTDSGTKETPAPSPQQPQPSADSPTANNQQQPGPATPPSTEPKNEEKAGDGKEQDNNQKQAEALMDALIKQTGSTAAAPSAPASEPSMPSQPGEPPPPPAQVDNYVVNPPGEKKPKKGSGKAIGLVVLLILLITLPIGVYYFIGGGNIGDLRSRADVYPTSPPPSACWPPNGTQCTSTGGELFSFAGDCVLIHCPQGCFTGGCDESDPGAWWERVKCNTTLPSRTDCWQIDTINAETFQYCIPANGTCTNDSIINCPIGCQGELPPTDEPSISRTPTPTMHPSITPSVTPTPIIAQCTNIMILKDGVGIDPKTLEPGDTCTIAVNGANATKARIRVNGGALDCVSDGWTETVQKDSMGRFVADFTLCPNTEAFTVEAEITSNGTDWF